MTKPPITIRFGKSNSAKIRIIQEAIDEPTTHLQVLEGLIDVGYANALKTLFDGSRIDRETFEIGQRQLPKYLRSLQQTDKSMGARNL